MKKARIIVLSGQSNAVGVGHVKCLGRRMDAAKINKYFNGYEKIKINYYSHDKMSDGFTVTKNGCTEIHKNTVGPELGIAEWLSKEFPYEDFYIVKYALGGASLKHEFLSPSSGGECEITDFKNEYIGFVDSFLNNKPLKSGWCYNGLVSLLNDSIGYLKKEGLSPEIIGFCWMQGESDATTLEDVNNYKIYFENFVNDLKNDVGEYMRDCIFVDGGISDVWKYYKEMNQFKREFAENNSGFVYINTIELGLTTHLEPEEKPDIFHYDCESVIKLGNFFAQSILSKRGYIE